MPVKSLAEDKPKILFYGAMMAIQNFGFFVRTRKPELLALLCGRTVLR